MKYPVVITLAILSLIIACAEAQSHNISWGTKGPKDQLLLRDIVIKKSKWLKIVTQDVDFPKNGTLNNKIISHIKVTDQYQNGNGGYATLYKGGPNYKNVTIHLKSQRGHGFNFILEIYGN